MTLPASGTITAEMINIELGRAGNAYFDINGAEERALAQKPSGNISFSDFWGKSSGPPTTNTMVAGASGSQTGFNRQAYGSLNPVTMPQGDLISYLMQDTSQSLFALATDGSHPQNYFTTLTINGVTYHSSAATFYDFGYAYWGWSNMPNLVNGNTYPVSIQ